MDRYLINPGDVDQSIDLLAVTPAGLPVTDIAPGDANLDLFIRREGGNQAEIITVAQDAPASSTKVHKDNSWFHHGGGAYRLDLIDAYVADDGSRWAIVWGTRGTDIILPAKIALDAQSSADVQAACELALDAKRLNELFTDPLSAQPVAGSLLGDLTEDDPVAVGTQRFNSNSLEQAPSGGSSPWSTAQRDEVMGELDSIVAKLPGGNMVDASAVKAQADQSLIDIRLNELMSSALSAQPALGSLFSDLTEDDPATPGTQRFNANALEQAPSGGGSSPWSTAEKDEVMAELDSLVTSVSGLSTFDPTSETVTLADNGITAAKIANDAIDASKISDAAGDKIADRYLNRVDGVEVGLTPKGALRLTTTMLAGAASGSPGGPVIYTSVATTPKARATFTVDGNGNRTSVVWDVTD